MNDTELFTVQEISESVGTDLAGTEIKPQIEVSEARRIIEAVLFAAGHPVTYTRLAEVLSSTPAAVRRICRRIQFSAHDSGTRNHAFML